MMAALYGVGSDRFWWTLVGAGAAFGYGITALRVSVVVFAGQQEWKPAFSGRGTG
jgi:hypothetical protein